MHPVSSERLAYGLSSRGESSFPERHIWSEPEEVGNAPNNNDVPYSQPGFPKLDVFGPGISSFWQQNWLTHGQPTAHRDPHHVDRITSPQGHVGHDFFASSPVAGDNASAQAEWELLRMTSTLPAHNYPWPHGPPHGESAIKIEDDSDSNWSLDGSSEDLQPPQLIRPQIQGLRRRGISRVAKVSRSATAPSYPSFRMNKRTPQTSDRQEPIEPTPHTSTSTSYDTVGDGAADPSTSPGDFASKVMEKRIAHKLSEKSRRNRLTAAIREIQKLMPLEESEERALQKGDPAPPAVYPHFSKVDVVEMAIGYIKRLQQENVDLKEKVRASAEEEDSRARQQSASEEPQEVES
ncbi:hypothetical protein OQA88_11138 [Cercophora sp. LCS_1]